MYGNIRIVKKKLKLNNNNDWISRFYKNKKNKIFLIYKAKLMIGYIRMELDRSRLNTSWALQKNFHNKGIMSNELLNATKNKLKKYKCLIHKNNIASITVAKRAKFICKEKKGIYFLFIKN